LLTRWAKESSVSDALLLKEDVNESLVSRVTNEGYAPDLTDDELEEIGRDPFLVAYALINPRERCVVTTEVSKPKKQRANRKLPDVCSSFWSYIVHCLRIYKALDFKTNWNHDR